MRGAPPNVLEQSDAGLIVAGRDKPLVKREEIVAYSVEVDDPVAFRNRVIDHYMGEMDRQYERYSQRLFGEGIELALGFDTAIIGLASTAALFENSAKDLATVISGFAGVQSAINKNLYFDRTLPALIVTMDAERTKVETEIIQRKMQPMAAYSLEAAIRDLRRYQQAGTLMRAVTKVTETASVEKQRAEDLYEQQMGFACAPDNELDDADQIRISDAIFDNYNAAVDDGDAAAELRLRSIALAFDLGAQGDLDDVFLRLTNAWQSRYCTQAEVDTLKAKLEPFLED